MCHPLSPQCSACVGLILRLLCLCPGGGCAGSSWGWRWEGKPCEAVAPDPGYRGWKEAGLRVRKKLQAPTSLCPSASIHGPMTHCILVTKHNYKDKIIKNFKKMTAEYSSPSLGPSESGALCTCTGHRPRTPAQHPRPLRTLVSRSSKRSYTLAAAILNTGP